MQTTDGAGARGESGAPGRHGAPSVGVHDRPQATLGTDLLAHLVALEAAVDAIAAVDPRDIGGQLAIEAAGRIQRGLDRLRGERLGLIGRIDTDGLWAQDSVRTLPHWLALTQRVSLTSARTDVRAARLLRDDLTATALAVRTGQITPEHVGIVVGIAATSPARRAALTDHVHLGDDPEYRGPDSDDDGPDSDGGGPESAGEDSENDQTHPHRPIRGEDVLLGLAANRSLRDFTQIARRFAVVTDPEADERGFRLAADREHLDLSPTLGGYHLNGFLTEEHGQVLSTTLTALMSPQTPGCAQSPAKRRALALVGLARLALDIGATPDVPTDPARMGTDTEVTGESTEPAAASPGSRSAHRNGSGSGSGSGSGTRPHLTVTVSWTELTALLGVRPRGARAATPDIGPHDAADLTELTARDLSDLLTTPTSTWQDGRGPVPRQVLARLAADCELSRVVFGPDSQVLDVGRSMRTLTGPRRRAIHARDRRCVWPLCEAPPPHTQIHHARTHWADGGSTSTDNAALLCWFHHDHVDTHSIAMTRTGDRWHFGRPGSYRPDPRDLSDSGTYRDHHADERATG